MRTSLRAVTSLRESASTHRVCRLASGPPDLGAALRRRWGSTATDSETQGQANERCHFDAQRGRYVAAASHAPQCRIPHGPID
jgi:hypothetical protein